MDKQIHYTYKCKQCEYLANGSCMPTKHNYRGSLCTIHERAFSMVFKIYTEPKRCENCSDVDLFLSYDGLTCKKCGHIEKEKDE